LPAIRWVLDDGGWPDGIVFAADTRAAVLSGHPWAERPDTLVVASREALHRLAVDAVITAAEPIVEHLGSIGRAGRSGLWHQVSDALPSVLTWQDEFPLSAQVVADFTAMLAQPHAPWKRRPTLQLLDQPWGPACVSHRGGCCLAYLDPAPGDPEQDEDHRLYEEAFPTADTDRRYCVTCKFRSFDDSRTRQLWWRQRAAAKAAAS
jgi:hypothetical protein